MKELKLKLTMMSMLFISSCAGLTEVLQEVGKLPEMIGETTTKKTPNLIDELETKPGLTSCLTKIHNRGKPPLAVVKDIISVVKGMPSAAFAVNDVYDVYSSVAPQLGPYTSMKHRRAVMAEVLIVLAGYESSWNYKLGRDTMAMNFSACTQEAGMFQTSGNSVNFGVDLMQLQYQKCINYAGRTPCDKFITCTKNDKNLAIEWTARLLRHTVNHHGPLKRKEIHQWLRPECVKAIEGSI